MHDFQPNIAHTLAMAVLTPRDEEKASKLADEEASMPLPPDPTDRLLKFLRTDATIESVLHSLPLLPIPTARG
jgi:hypothetical protein